MSIDWRKRVNVFWDVTRYLFSQAITEVLLSLEVSTRHFVVARQCHLRVVRFFFLISCKKRLSSYDQQQTGVRVPTFALDFSKNRIPENTIWSGMSHVSDWFPTLSSFAGIDRKKIPNDLDGHDLSDALSSSSSSPRNEVLLEM